MNLYLQNFILYYTIWVASIALCVAIGYASLLIIKAKIDNNAPHYFILTTFWVGFITLSTLYAIIITKGQTILVGNILIALIYYYFNRKNTNVNPIIKVKSLNITILYVIITTSIAYIYACFDYIPSATNLAPNYMWDTVVYSKQIDFLNVYGAENYIKDGNVFPEFRKVIPYHYLELWNTAFLVQIIQLPSVVLLQCVTYQLLLFGVMIGLLAVLEYFVEIKSYHYFIIIVLCFFGGIHFEHKYDWLWWYDFYYYTHEGVILTYILFQKIYIPAVFFAFVYVLLLKEKYAQTYLVLASLSLAYILFLPISVGVVVLFGVFLVYRKGLIKQDIIYIIVFFITCAFAFIFYKMFGDTSKISGINAAQTLLNKIISFNLDFKQGIGFLVNTVLINFPLIILIVFAIIVNFNNFKSNQPIKFTTLFVILYVLVALGISIIFKNESFEFFQFYLMSVTALKWFIPVIIYGVMQTNWQRMCVVSVYLLVACYHVFVQTNIKLGVWNLKANETAYLQNVIKMLPKNNAHVFVACVHQDTTKVADLMWTVGKYLKAIRPYTHTTNLNAYQYKNAVFNHQIEVHRKSYTPLWGYQPVVQYIRKKHISKNEPTIQEIEAYQINFLKEYNIKYLLVEKGATIPRNLQDKVSKSIVDNISGEQFYVLNL